MQHSRRRLSRPFLILSLVFFAAGVAVAAEEGLTLEETVGLRTASGALMSPNGDAIAYILSVPRTLYEDSDGPAWRQLHVVSTEGVSRPYFSGEVSVAQLRS